MKRLCRNKKDAKLAGVCAGLGDYFDIDPVIVRLVFLTDNILGCGDFRIYYCLDHRSGSTSTEIEFLGIISKRFAYVEYLQ